MRLWYNGITSAFQAEDAGSTPVGRFFLIQYMISEETYMGKRGEIYSTKLVRNDRTYFFNVKENLYGDLYLNIVESKPTDTEGRFLRQSLLVYQEDLGEFVKEFQKSLDYIKVNGTKKPVGPRVRREYTEKEETAEKDED